MVEYLKSFQSKKGVARVLLGVFFIGASSFHFFSDAELQIIPRK